MQGKTIVLVGASGDLARRKLFPALRKQVAAGAPLARLIAVSRRPIHKDDMFLPDDSLYALTEYRQMDLERPEPYAALTEKLATYTTPSDVICYLAVPPGAAVSVAAHMAQAGLGDALLALEKPFGSDTASAHEEAQALAHSFSEAQVYRVDHYLAKRLAERLAALVHAPQDIARIDIEASEIVDVEHRMAFYEASGALRDFGNHLLSLVVGALGAHDEAARANVLRDMRLVSAARAQYDGYVGAAETFMALGLSYAPVPGLVITLASGKALKEKKTSVRITLAGGEVIVLEDVPGDPDAYERIWAGLFTQDRRLFLGFAEVMESWRLMDDAKAAWYARPMPRYACGTPLAVVRGALS